MCSSLTAESLKQKIREKEGLQFYLMPERVEAFVPAISTTNDRRFLLDNPDKYLSDFNVFRDLFWKSCGTVVVTAEENITLSKLTENNDNYYKVFVPTNKKYEHVGINLLSLPDKKQKWKGVDVVEASTTDLYFPDDLIEYEKDYLVVAQKQPTML